jgi:hypothetical protein
MRELNCASPAGAEKLSAYCHLIFIRFGRSAGKLLLHGRNWRFDYPNRRLFLHPQKIRNLHIHLSDVHTKQPFFDSAFCLSHLNFILLFDLILG